MAFRYSRGDFTPFAWQATGGQAAVLNIKGHSLDLMGVLADVTSTGSGGGTARIGQKLDADGTVNLALDLDALPWLAVPNIVPFVRGVGGFYISPIAFIQIPLIIEKIHFETAVDHEVQWSTTMKMDAHSGLLVFPPIA